MRRPWFQFHLSTAIVLMFVAAALLWANMAPYEMVHLSMLRQQRNLSYGWPMPNVIWYEQDSDMPIGTIGSFVTLYFAINLCIWLLILATVFAASEWWYRIWYGETDAMRPVWRVSRTTATVVIAVAVILVILNLAPYAATGRYGGSVLAYGWPWQAVFVLKASQRPAAPALYGKDLDLVRTWLFDPFYNIAVGAGIVFATAVLLEWPIRRRQAPHHSDPGNGKDEL